MRVVRKDVYYCDHCNKRYLAKGAAVKHEARCTANPKRVCGFCQSSNEINLQSFDRFLELASYSDPDSVVAPVRSVIEGQYDAFIAAVSDAASECPACVLAIIRQLRLTRVPWDYQEAKSKFWAKINEEEYRKEFQYGYF